MTKKCGRCGEEKAHDSFRTHSHAPGRVHSYCRPCEREYSREYAKKNRKQIAGYKAQYRQETLACPKAAERHRAYNREAQKRWRDRNKEKERERARRYRERLKADPERWARMLESERLGYRLRQERRGRQVTRHMKVTMPSHRVEEVIPARPLADVLEIHMLEQGYDNKTLARAAGVDDSNISKILHGKKDGVYLSVADKILTALDLPMKLVYPEL